MLRFLCLALLALALAACGSDEDTITDQEPASSAAAEPATSEAAESASNAPQLVTADDVAGRAFVLEEAEVGGQPKQLVVPIEIAFEADRLAAQPGCNGASGGYAMQDGKLTLTGPLAQTMMMCADEALVQQDAWFATFLEASPLVTLEGDAITLTTDDTTLRGRDKEVASPDLPLEGTEWRLTSRIDGAGADGAVSSELWMEDSSLTFEPGGTLQGSTACGGVLGTWELDAADEQVTITLEPHGPCTGDQGQLEEQTFSYLSGPLTVEIDSDQATLTRPDGTGVTLQALAPQPPDVSEPAEATTAG